MTLTVACKFNNMSLQATDPFLVHQTVYFSACSHMYM